MKTGEQLKLDGIAQVAANNSTWIDRMRDLAIGESILSMDGTVTSDNLRYLADRLGDHPKHQNAWGAVFRGPNWKCVGRTKSTYRTNHAREIKIWLYEPAGEGR